MKFRSRNWHVVNLCNTLASIINHFTKSHYKDPKERANMYDLTLEINKKIILIMKTLHRSGDQLRIFTFEN
jgi:hypothetical protein